MFDPQPDWRHPVFSERALYGVTLGVLLGGLAQLGMQLPSLFKLGFRFKWELNLSDPRLRQVWALAWPSMIAGAAVQVNVLVNGMFASEIDGARSWLNCAFRMMQFPIGIFGVAIATVTLPAVARLHAKGAMAEAGKTIEEALRLAFFLTLPAAVGLAVLAPDIIQVIYQHGHFSAASTAATASALRAYAIGLAAYAAIKVVTPCFYALDRRRIPLNVSLVGIGLCISLNFALVKIFHLGHVGLAATTGCIAILNFTQLAIYLRRDVHFGAVRAWFRFGILVGGSAGVCGLTAWLLKHWLVGFGQSFPFMVLALGIEIGVAGLVYFGLTHVCRITETHYIVGLMRKKLLGKI